jgi:hypothetical protein
MKPDVDGALISEQLGLQLVPQGTLLRLRDPRTGTLIHTRREQVELERERADEQRRRADDLAAELERLRAGKKTKRNGANGSL